MTAIGPTHVIAVLDANVLYPAPLRDFFMWQAANGVFAARWTDEIHEEWTENLLSNRPELSRERLQRTRELMDRHVDDVPVTGYERHIDKLELPDPDDRHVLAAAIECNASYIVTDNLSDFPEEALSRHGIEAVNPDEFGLLLLERSRETVIRSAVEHWQSLRNPPKSQDQYLVSLRRIGLEETAGRLADHLWSRLHKILASARFACGCSSLALPP